MIRGGQGRRRAHETSSQWLVHELGVNRASATPDGPFASPAGPVKTKDRPSIGVAHHNTVVLPGLQTTPMKTGIRVSRTERTGTMSSSTWRVLRALKPLRRPGLRETWWKKQASSFNLPARAFRILHIFLYREDKDLARSPFRPTRKKDQNGD